MLAPGPVKLIIGFIFKNEDTFYRAERILEKKYGKIDFISEILEFNHTDYYEKEFGQGLKRRFISFRRLIPAEDLSKIKNFTNKVEKKLSGKGLRRINIDPGYLNLAKLVLASTKDFTHRVYLGKGIFAEITLFYQDKAFRPREWTYPDYRTAEYGVIFNQIREIYAKQKS